MNDKINKKTDYSDCVLFYVIKTKKNCHGSLSARLSDSQRTQSKATDRVREKTALRKVNGQIGEQFSRAGQDAVGVSRRTSRSYSRPVADVW